LLGPIRGARVYAEAAVGLCLYRIAVGLGCLLVDAGNELQHRANKRQALSTAPQAFPGTSEGAQADPPASSDGGATGQRTDRLELLHGGRCRSCDVSHCTGWVSMEHRQQRPDIGQHIGLWVALCIDWEESPSTHSNLGSSCSLPGEGIPHAT